MKWDIKYILRKKSEYGGEKSQFITTVFERRLGEHLLGYNCLFLFLANLFAIYFISLMIMQLRIELDVLEVQQLHRPLALV